ncbi:D-arabinono-1,4-lactone oxidase [Micromonospora sp. NPDC050276]|uniref:D-arabinono-1,4-lactone oxidase n=1 Tax=Micromonospora sp. NPDC050276 TaxID=3364278 RepID=UPI00378CA176
MRQSEHADAAGELTPAWQAVAVAGEPVGGALLGIGSEPDFLWGVAFGGQKRLDRGLRATSACSAEAPAGSITAARPLFDDIQRLLYRLGGRPHWGKYFNPGLLPASNTDGFHRFRQALRTFDPHRRFENDTFYRTLGLAPTRPGVDGPAPLSRPRLAAPTRHQG